MRSRVARGMILAFIFILYFYLCWSLFHALPTFWRTAGWLIISALLFSILWVFFVFWTSDANEVRLHERVLQWIAFGGMGLMSFLLVVSIARDLLSLVGLAALRTPQASAGVILLASALFLIGTVNAGFGVRVRESRVPIKNLPEGLAGFRIAQISDLHIGTILGGGYAKKIVELVNSCAPDLIALTGDLVDGMVSGVGEEVAPLALLSAPLGKFYVPGNHEYYWEGPAWIDKFRSLGMTPLLNENKVLNWKGSPLVIAGVLDPASTMAGEKGPDLERASGTSDTHPKILLCHQPQFAPQAETRGFDLQLSGHTHGGQFFPWTLVVNLVYDFPHGLHQLGRMWLYVSRGTGFWGPPVRLGAPAEVSLLILERA